MRVSSFIPALAVCIFVFAPHLDAGQRRFTNVYESTTGAAGGVDIENWATWKTGRGVDQFEFRHEVEFGVTDRLQLSIYAVDWTLDARQHRGHYDDSAVEAIYSMTNPVADFLGSAIYGEVRVGDELLELESKLILQKNLGRWVITYNATLEARWEGRHFAESNGEINQTLGASYEISPRLLVGAEVMHEIDLPEWTGRGHSIVYAGPNTPLAQLTEVAGEPDFQTRIIVGVNF